MNNHSIWAISLLFGLAGCAGHPLRSQALAVPLTPASPQWADLVQSNTSIPVLLAQATVDTVDPSGNRSGDDLGDDSGDDSTDRANRPEQTRPAAIQQDYEATTPLPSTGAVTIRQSIRDLDPDQLIAECPPDSAPYALAESTNYRVQICSQEYDPWLPKYYIGQAKDGSGELRITSSNPDAARQLTFQQGGYTYIIDRDGARPEVTNAYLEIYTPSGDNYAEALLYLYETGRAPQ
jgi:hypothetical protein